MPFALLAMPFALLAMPFALLAMPFAFLAMPFALLAMPFALRRKVRFYLPLLSNIFPIAAGGVVLPTIPTSTTIVKI